jgi:hypothetical protein
VNDCRLTAAAHAHGTGSGLPDRHKYAKKLMELGR